MFGIFLFVCLCVCVFLNSSMFLVDFMYFYVSVLYQLLHCIS